MTRTTVWTVVVLILIALGVWWWHSHSNNNYVAPTPTPVATTTQDTGMKTYSDPTSGVSFVYPASLGTKYIDAIDWPPKVQVENKSMSCTNAGSATSTAGQTTKRTINGRTYCVTIETEGAAGSIYHSYAYATENEGKTYYFTFSLRYPQCANYDDPKKSECQTEEDTFNVDNVIDSVVVSAFSNAS